MSGKTKKIFIAAISVVSSLIVSGAIAEGGYGQHPAAKAVIDELVAEGIYKEAELQSLFNQAQKKQSILDAISRPAEKSLEWKKYRKIFVTERSANKGIKFWQKNADALVAASEKYGVPAEVIVSIIGVETRYGRIMGSYRVIDALSTLAFDYPKRSPFFTKELKHFLRLVQEQGQDPLLLKGSYAGAMGFGQFMPSSYRNYAVDFDGDKVADIWKNPTDAIGSVANYFKSHGWQTGKAVVSQASLQDGFNPELANQSLKPKYTIGELKANGFDSVLSLDDNLAASLVKLEGQKGTEYWLGLQNFYVITRYNHSRMYAMSVYQLAQKIKSLKEKSEV